MEQQTHTNKQCRDTTHTKKHYKIKSKSIRQKNKKKIMNFYFGNVSFLFLSI